jgi:hypothetical protein
MKPFSGLPLDQVNLLLDSAVHEHRFVAMLILVTRYKRQPRDVADFYLAAVRRGRVNNWDLVDCSAEFILGEYLFDRPRDLLFGLAASASTPRCFCRIWMSMPRACRARHCRTRQSTSHLSSASTTGASARRSRRGASRRAAPQRRIKVG